jgi:hypothetical protein
MSEKKTYEVLEPVRLDRRSRAVGDMVEAHPDEVAELVGTVLREVDADEGAGEGHGQQGDRADQGQGDAGSGETLGDTEPSPATGDEAAAPAAKAEPVTKPAAKKTTTKAAGK